MPGELLTLTQSQLRRRTGSLAYKKALRVWPCIKLLLGQCGPVLLECGLGVFHRSCPLVGRDVCHLRHWWIQDNILKDLCRYTTR